MDYIKNTNILKKLNFTWVIKNYIDWGWDLQLQFFSVTYRISKIRIKFKNIFRNYFLGPCD